MSFDGCVIFLGVLLMAMGAGALNQWQDRRLDARMARTQARPLPTGRLRSAHAAILGLGLALAGFLVLARESGGPFHPPPLLGLLAFLWYLGAYYFLKRATAFAALPGSLTGALPPLIGWTAAGESWNHPAVLSICCFFLLWQIPHFWLLMVRRGPEYAAAGLPSITRVFTAKALIRVTGAWFYICLASGAALSLAPTRTMRAPWSGLALLLSIAASVGGGILWAHAYRTAKPQQLWPAFHIVNAYALAIALCLTLSVLWA